LGAIEYIVFFDGHCNLCNSTVDFIFRKDRKQRIFVASLQSDFAQRLLPPDYVQAENLDTIVLYAKGKIYVRSTAVLKVLQLLPFGYKLLYGTIIIPRFIRDAVYKWIARNRLRWFGRKETCRLPEPHEKARFLDQLTPEELGLPTFRESNG
jgi:predicted DCC family thiol-disulfide oxidoreductase YuxK